MIFATIAVSVAVMVAPTFFSKQISRASINKEVHLELFLDSTKDVELVFFGYTGCSTICTPRLEKLAYFYDSLDSATQKKLGVVFLDISSPKDEKLPQRFAEFFHKEFKGVFLDKGVVREYTKEFNVYFAKSLFDSSEFDHSANLYLLTRKNGKKQLRYIYNSYPFDFQQISLDIKELIYEDA
jgi:protein SCO1/2